MRNAARNRATLLGVFVALFIPHCVGNASGDTTVESIANDVRVGLIPTITVFALPYDLRTRSRVTPELLRDSGRRKDLPLSGELRVTLLEALEATRTTPTGARIDLRWGVILRDDSGTERHSVFLSGKSWFRPGRTGLIDRSTFELNSALVDWFESNFAGLQEKE